MLPRPMRKYGLAILAAVILGIELVGAVASGSFAQIAVFLVSCFAGVLIAIGCFVYLVARVTSREPDSRA